MTNFVSELRAMTIEAQEANKARIQKEVEETCLNIIENSLKPSAKNGGTRKYITLSVSYDRKAIANWFENNGFKVEVSGGALIIDWSEEKCA